MATKIKRENIPIYQPPHRLYKVFLFNKKNDASISEYTWGLIRKDMLANGVSEKRIKKAEKEIPWKMD